jgi:hypothetical protein
MKNNEHVNYEWMRDLGLWDKSDPANTFLRKGRLFSYHMFAYVRIYLLLPFTAVTQITILLPHRAIMYVIVW